MWVGVKRLKCEMHAPQCRPRVWGDKDTGNQRGSRQREARSGPDKGRETESEIRQSPRKPDRQERKES